MLSHEILSPPGGAKPTSAVILLHGLGDCGAGLIDLGALWQRGLPQTLFLAPNAPFPCDLAPFGFQWFSAQDWTPSVVLEGIKLAAPYLNAYIDHVMEAYDLKPDRIALVGFSQGTMMGLYVAPRREPSLAGVLGYSGALFGAESLRQERKSSPRILLIHGKDDEVVPFESLARARSGFHNLNMNVDIIERPGLGHSIDDVGLSEGLRFLQKALA